MLTLLAGTRIGLSSSIRPTTPAAGLPPGSCRNLPPTTPRPATRAPASSARRRKTSSKKPATPAPLRRGTCLRPRRRLRRSRLRVEDQLLLPHRKEWLLLTVQRRPSKSDVLRCVAVTPLRIQVRCLGIPRSLLHVYSCLLFRITCSPCIATPRHQCLLTISQRVCSDVLRSFERRDGIVRKCHLLGDVIG